MTRTQLIKALQDSIRDNPGDYEVEISGIHLPPSFMANIGLAIVDGDHNQIDFITLNQ